MQFDADDGLPRTVRILSVNDLAFKLGYSRTFLEQVANSAGSLHDPFVKPPKLRWFPKNPARPKRRVIDNPVGALKEVQSRIQRRLLKPLVFPSYLCGGVKGKTVIDNVSMHIGTRVLVTIDIKSFFPSISHRMVYAIWNETLQCSPPVAAMLTKLTTFRRHLPQGAPTSTLLANLALYTVDEPIRKACSARGIRYSTWVDDLAFSGNRVSEIFPTAVDALKAGGFRISHRKLRIMGTGGRMILNGVLLGRFPGVVKARIDQLRSGVHKLSTGQVPTSLMERYCQSLTGAIQQLGTICPRKTARLMDKYEAALDAQKSTLRATAGRE